MPHLSIFPEIFRRTPHSSRRRTPNHHHRAGRLEGKEIHDRAKTGAYYENVSISSTISLRKRNCINCEAYKFYFCSKYPVSDKARGT